MVPLNCAVSERVVRGGLGYVCSSSLHTELYNILTQQTCPSSPRTTLSDVESWLLAGKLRLLNDAYRPSKEYMYTPWGLRRT